MAKLVLKLKDQFVKEIILNRDAVTTIGRNRSNNIQLDNPSVSRFHAKIYKQDWPFYIEDLDSANGIFVNGKKINWKCSLKNNDEITIGKNTFIFVDHDSDYKDKDLPDIEETIRTDK